MENHLILMNLPSHIILDILLRLPAKSIINCKCVCRGWLEMISAPEFVPLHFLKSRPGLVVHHAEMFKNYLKFIEFKDSVYHTDLSYDSRFRFDLTTLSVFDDADIVVDGSVNGFLFLRDVNYKHETLYICNPVTREYVILPQPRGVVRYPDVVTHGFGLSPKTGEYKVVRILHERILHPITGACVGIPSAMCQVYTLGTNSWREIAPNRFAYNSNSIGVFFEGNIHWLVQDLEGSELISYFDLENEVFRPFPAPFPGRRLVGSLSVLNGYLCLCDNTSEYDIEIWVMKEYGVKNSWTKEIIVNKMPALAGPSFQVVRALKVFQDSVILLLWGDFFMFYYDIKRNTAQEVDIDQTRGPNSIEAMLHVPSFLSLRSLTKEYIYMI